MTASTHARTPGLVAIVALALLVAPRIGRAQEAAAAESRRPIGSLSVGVMQFDLSGTGSAPMVALRVDLPWSTHLWFEPGVSIARPDQQFGARSTFVVAEVHAHAMLPLGGFAPYLGGGIGRAFDVRDEEFGGTQAELSLAGAVGVRAQLSARAGARAELRIRTLSTELTGWSAEWTAGLSWRF
jgi:hypothetical protein